MSGDLVGAIATWLRAAFTENLVLKALSLAFALGLFVYQKGQQDQQQRQPGAEDADRGVAQPITKTVDARPGQGHHQCCRAPRMQHCRKQRPVKHHIRQARDQLQ